jgi:hypothetical protein
MYITRLGEAKRFWNTPKVGCVYQNRFQTQAVAERESFSFVKIFCLPPATQHHQVLQHLEDMTLSDPEIDSFLPRAPKREKLRAAIERFPTLPFPLR